MICFLEENDVEGTSWFSVTVHKSYDDFVELSNKVRKELCAQHNVLHVESKRLVFRTEKLYPKPLSFRHLEEVFQLTHTLDHLEDVFQPIDTLNQTHKRKNKKQIS